MIAMGTVSLYLNQSKMKASITTYILGLIFTLVGIGASFLSDKSQQIIILSATLPIITLLVADRISHLFKQHEDAEKLRDFINKTIPQTSAIHVFKNSAEAMSYLSVNIKNAVRIYNTRITDSQVERDNIINNKLTTDFDEKVRLRIKNGLDYKWIASHHYREYGKQLLKDYNSDAQRNVKIGSISCCILDDEFNPIFNFIILHYNDSKEVLFGWSIISGDDYTEKVLLFRDNRVVEYFNNIFNQYVMHAKSLRLE